MARARAGHGADHRARHLRGARHAWRAQEISRHRHPHRRRRGGDSRWLRGAHRWRAEGRRGYRKADGLGGLMAAAKEFDVAIVGGGMVGASFALALRATGLRTLLIESVPPESASQPSFDERTTALGNGSRQIFESLGVWEAMAPEAAPIRSIHVSDAGRFGVARLDAAEQGLAAFGYVVPNRTLGRVLWQALRQVPNLTLAVPAQVKTATLRDDAVLLELAGADEPGVRASVA